MRWGKTQPGTRLCRRHHPLSEETHRTGVITRRPRFQDWWSKVLARTRPWTDLVAEIILLLKLLLQLELLLLLLLQLLQIA